MTSGTMQTKQRKPQAASRSGTQQVLLTDILHHAASLNRNIADRVLSAILQKHVAPNQEAEADDSLASKEVLTTGEAATLCKVSQQTIIRCFDAERLGGFKVPESRFRRIHRNSLIALMMKNNVPTDALMDESGRKHIDELLKQENADGHTPVEMQFGAVLKLNPA